MNSKRWHTVNDKHRLTLSLVSEPTCAWGLNGGYVMSFQLWRYYQNTRIFIIYQVIKQGWGVFLVMFIHTCRISFIHAYPNEQYTKNTSPIVKTQNAEVRIIMYESLPCRT